MRNAICLIFMLVCFGSSRAQYTVTLKPGDSMAEFTTRYVYRNPVFMQSKVIFNDGKSTPAKLNYNQLSDRMEFIGPKGDTLELVDNHLIKEVLIDKSLFRYHDGFFEIIKDTPAMKLAMKTPLRQVGQKKVGAMGIASQTTTIDTYQSMQGTSRQLKLTPNVEHVFSVAPVFYFGDTKSDFLPATQKNLQRILPGKKDLIADYMKNNQVSFSKIEDILSLLTAIKAQ